MKMNMDMMQKQTDNLPYIDQNIIDVVEFDKKSLTVYYKLKNGFSGNYKIKMIDEKTNGYFYYENIYLDSNLTYWTSCDNHIIKNYIYKNIKIVFELNNKVVFEESYIVNENIKKSPISDLYFENCLVNINTYLEVFVLNTYSKFNILIEENDVVVDIGSNVGAFIKLAIVNKCKQIYCCEPNPSCIDLIKTMYGENKNVIINECAIADFIGHSELIIPSLTENNTGCAKITQSTTSTDYSNSKKIQIKTVTFKEYIKTNNITKIDFLKVDCEGGEEFIFNEINIEYIKQNVSKIAIEYHNDKKDYINNLLKNSGFETHLDSTSSNLLGMIYAKNTNF